MVHDSMVQILREREEEEKWRGGREGERKRERSKK